MDIDNDTNSLFGDHTKVRNFSDSEDEYDDDPDPEARRQVEAPEGQEGQETTNDGEEAKKVVPAKVKRVIQNPQPKLDPQRLAGPRGIFHVQKLYKDVKWKGKGHEKDDLSLLLKRLEHWAHRLYPKLPFQDTLEQIEKLGMKKNVQVHMKKIRLDMLNEDGKNPDDDDGVKRGPEEPEEVAPQVDVFDELIGENFSSGPPTASQIFPVPTAPPISAPKPNPTPLTEEQKERLERNKRLAEEKRKARFLQQMEQKQAEAYAAINKEDKTDRLEEVEKSNNNAELESSNLSLKENMESKSLEESKTKEADDMEVDEFESDKHKVISSSTKKSSQETYTVSTSEKTVNTPKKDKRIEVDIESKENKGEIEIETDNTSENIKQVEKENKDEEVESIDLSLKENKESSGAPKTKELYDMEVDEVESDKQNDAASLSKQSSQETHTESISQETDNTYKKDKIIDDVDIDSSLSKQSSQETHTESISQETDNNTYKKDKIIEDVDIDSGESKGEKEIETDDISGKDKEKTSEELSPKTIIDSNSKEQHEGICTEEEMLAMLDSDL